MAIKRTKRNIKKTAKPVAPKENVVKREKTKKPKTQKPLEKKAPPKASQPKPKQPKRDYNREYSNSFEVVRGSRLIKFKRRIISYGIIAAIILTVLIIHILTPTGLVESIQNKVTTFGNANLPATVYSQNSEQFIRYGDAVCSLNDTFFEVYSKSGKLMQAVSHGMSDPVLETSEARFLLYDRSRYGISIYNYSSELYQATFEHNIISADISRSGAYAVVTDSDMFMNSVYVYNKNNKLVYTWNSAGSYVTDVAVSNNGKSIAVCLVNAKGGVYSSSVYVLDFNSASPKVKYDFDYLVSSVTTVNSKYVLANGTDKAILLGINASSMTEVAASSVRYFATAANGYSAVCFGRSNNERDNTVAVVSKNGEITASIKADYIVSSISLGDDYIAVHSEKTVIAYDFEGNEIARITAVTKPLFVAAVSDNYVLALDNTKLYKLDLK